MDNINDVKLTPMGDSNFVKPLRMHYTQNGVEKIWDLIKIHDSVSIIIYNTTRKVLVFVKQFRPAVYFAAVPDQDRELKIDTNKYPAENGITIELCAGIVDKNIPLEEVARIEVLEECGYDVPVSNLERIISYRSGIGVCGDIQTVFYAEVTDNMKVGKGGGNLEEGEFIELVEMTVAEAKKYLEKDTVRSPGGFLFALLWFFQNKSTI
ncbi:uridine diphosphate glucose pyrophosphatase NUDT14-like [Periplaneta americana]|uniref:uridine diphosphate glucose pyrophosphatase NUDT14-like n=1 Tax=Periplaneta americana TaxID=6978 RepID=UPI0037E79D87